MDDFGVKYIGEDDKNHLIKALQETYEITIDEQGKVFCGIHLNWDYKNKTVDLSMPGYVNNALEKLNHPAPARKQHAPSAYIPPQYGKQPQQPSIQQEHTLTEQQQKRLQTVCGLFLYYARAVDGTMQHALNDLAIQITRGNDATLKAMNHFLNYCHTHPDATIRYYASDMQLILHSDAGYNNTFGARSRAGGHFYLTNKRTKKHINNGAILALAKVIKNVMASATEAELKAMYINAREAVHLRTILEELGHPQPPTPIITDNAVAAGIINKTMKQHKSKAMDMNYHWIQDRIANKEFEVQWEPGETNKADYYTKHHSGIHHQKTRHKYVHTPKQLVTARRGCVNSSPTKD